MKSHANLLLSSIAGVPRSGGTLAWCGCAAERAGYACGDR
jgi:hypothetical protein